MSLGSFKILSGINSLKLHSGNGFLAAGQTPIASSTTSNTLSVGSTTTLSSSTNGNFFGNTLGIPANAPTSFGPGVGAYPFGAVSSTANNSVTSGASNFLGVADTSLAPAITQVAELGVVAGLTKTAVNTLTGNNNAPSPPGMNGPSFS